MTEATLDAGTRGPLTMARVVFTGKLASMTRREARERVRQAGGRVTSSVSRRTSMLVVGMDGWPVLPDGRMSGALERAEALSARGACIEIISEDVFLERVGGERWSPPGEKSYSFDQVCDVLGLEPTVLRRWEALGLIRSSGGGYDFQDLVSLRTIAELIGNGVSPSAIARSVRGLASVLPSVERPLAQLKIVEQSGTLMAELGDTLVAPNGQLVLQFDAADAPAPETLSLAAAVAAPATDRWTAQDWLEHGHDCEEDEDYARAEHAYREALALQPDFPEAHFNLGNALRARGRLEAAAEQLTMAVTRDPTLAAAWYNLADVQEELGRLADAIESLEAAVAVCPGYADAVYNLALFCDEAGRRADAQCYWREYLKLDPTSAWAEQARRYLS